MGGVSIRPPAIQRAFRRCGDCIEEDGRAGVFKELIFIFLWEFTVFQYTRNGIGFPLTPSLIAVALLTSVLFLQASVSARIAPAGRVTIVLIVNPSGCVVDDDGAALPSF